MPDDDKRISFDREKAVFDQNCEQIRTLIQELHKKPLMSATVTGALVTAMSIFKTDKDYTIGLLALIAVLNAFIAITCLRLRDVIESYIEKASRFSPDFGAKGGRPTKPILPWIGAFSVSIGYAFMMGTISLAAVVAPFFVFGWTAASGLPFAATFIALGLYIYYSHRHAIDFLRDPTIKYYNKNWQDYAHKTESLDMSDIRNEFLQYVPKGGKILDVGAGTGRDARAFVTLGYPTVAVEPVPAFAGLLRNIPGLEVDQITAEEVEGSALFDGIWACASLLHLDEINLNIAMDRLQRALKPGGYIYISVWNGTRNERAKDGRRFHDLTMDQLRRLVTDRGLLEVKGWPTKPKGSGTNQSLWNNIIARKPS